MCNNIIGLPESQAGYQSNADYWQSRIEILNQQLLIATNRHNFYQGMADEFENRKETSIRRNISGSQLSAET